MDKTGELILQLREQAQSYQSNAWNKLDGGQDFSLAAMSLELAADALELSAAREGAKNEALKQCEKHFADSRAIILSGCEGNRADLGEEESWELDDCEKYLAVIHAAEGT